MMDIKLRNISMCGHRNIKLLGAGITVFTLAILGNYFFLVSSQAQCGEHNSDKDFSPFKQAE